MTVTTTYGNAKKQLTSSAKRYIVENYNKKFSLNDIAAELFVNKYYLARTFKETTGITLLHFHNYTRCMKALPLLRDMNHTIAYAASMSGFRSASNFCHVFKRTMNCTPMEYRTGTKRVLPFKEHINTSEDEYQAGA